MKYPDIANRFYTILSKRQMTPAELARKAGLNESSISQYMNGIHKPSNVSAAKMAAVLKVNPLWLMGYEVAMEENTSYVVEENQNDKTAANEALRYSTLLTNAGFILRNSEDFIDVYSLSASDNKMFKGVSLNLDINDVKEYNSLVEGAIRDVTIDYFKKKMQETLLEMAGDEG